MNNLVNKLYEEHRAAQKELFDIELSKESTEEKIKQIIHLFDSELKPHFLGEENTILKDNNDPVSIDILNEHQIAYKLIDKFKNNLGTKEDVSYFIKLMKGHILKEDKYFGSLNKNDYSWIYAIIALIFICTILFLIFGLGTTS